MMRTSNLFPLARRYSKQKARSRVQSTTNGGKLLTGLFLFCCGYSRGKKEKCDVSIFLSCTHKKIERGVCFQYNVFCIEARIEFDIVNIGLHFFLKNVRPYAASCSEA